MNCHLIQVQNVSTFDIAGFLEKGDSERTATIDRLLVQLLDENNPTTRPVAGHSLALVVKKCKITSQCGSHILTAMLRFMNDSQSRESGLILLKNLLDQIGRVVEPYALPLLNLLFQLHGDRSTPVRDLSSAVVSKLASIMCSHAFRVVFPIIITAIQEEDWRIKVGALSVLQLLSHRVSTHLSPLLPQLIPRVTECIYDSKRQVQTTAIEALKEACRAITNDDIRPLVPLLVSVIARPEESASTLDALLETTFVAAVDASVLALIAPLLGKALRGRSSVLKRKASRVIDIMCRLVQEPIQVAPFIPLLLPALNKVIDEIVDAEVCEVAVAARAILLKAMGGNEDTDVTAAANEDVANSASAAIMAASASSPVGLDVEVVRSALRAEVEKVLPPQPPQCVAVLDHVATMSAHLVAFSTLPNPNTRTTDSAPADPWRFAVAMTPLDEWRDCFIPYCDALVYKTSHHTANGTTASHDADSDSVSADMNHLHLNGNSEEEPHHEEHMCQSYRLAALGNVPDRVEEDDADGTNLCNIEFSLAFGGKILLQNTHLKLGKGRRYGVMGKNGAGKTTLLTNIGSGNIEGLPTHLKTVYVQHDDASDDGGVPLIDEITNGKDMVSAGVTREEIIEALTGIGFTDLMLSSPRSALSGGWKMKVLIMRAMLSRANVLLLDEVCNNR